MVQTGRSSQIGRRPTAEENLGLGQPGPFGSCISLPSLGFWKTGCEAGLTGFESLSLSAMYPQASNFSIPQFSHLENGDADGVYLIGIDGG